MLTETEYGLQTEMYQTLVDNSDTGIIVRESKSCELLYVNRAARDMLHAANDDCTGKKCYEFFFRRSTPCPFCGPNCGTDCKPMYIPELDRYFSIKNVSVNWRGREALVRYLDDVTELERSRIRITDLVQNVPCGICLYRWNGYELTPVMTNARFAELLGEAPESCTEGGDGLRFRHAHPDDLPGLRKAAYAALGREGRIDHTYRSLNAKTGEYLWLRTCGAAVKQPDGSLLVYISFFDVTQEHMTEQKLRENERTLEHAAEMAGLWYWTYDPELDRAYMDERNQRYFGVPAVMDNFMERWEALGIIHPDSAEAHREAYRRAAGGEETVTIEIKYFSREGNVHWARFLLVSVREERRSTPTIICTAFPIDAEHELQAKYELEKKKPSLGEKNLLVHALFNLTTGETLEYVYQDGDEVPPEWRTAFTGEGKDNLDLLLIDEEERGRYREINEKSRLVERYEKGETELSIDYRRRLPGGDVVWTRNILHLVRDPDSSDILLFEYCYDVEEEKTREILYHSLATDNYDYVIKISGRTRRYTVVHLSGGTGLPPLDGPDADAISEYLTGNVVPEESETTLANTLVSGITANLRDRERFSFTFRTAKPDGKVSYKKITQYYIDRQREVIVMTREDVTALIQVELEKNSILASALEAANQASQAKSQFLSRMSHELRTPMNAIIGLAALAAGETGNKSVMEDTIGKIGLSARYLLSLINDILEMSRIESGRMTLSEVPFSFEELISSVNNLIYSQASAKGLDYDAVVNSFTEDTYTGDATKLQQILVNVLGNAVKFTPAGGKVTFAMEQLRRSNDRATLRFVVSDTGVGIDEAFIPHIFDPFSQESASFTSTSTGTGLGLAITKSMVEMMNGSIRVQSIKNVGSTFTIEVSLGIPEDSQRRLDLLSEMNLSRLRALVVDDDVVVCQSTEKTLSAMGMQAEWVESGARAVERVTDVHGRKCDFDMIFIDWKMPDMDGLETTRQIRRIVGPDITIIILTAYDWKAIEAEAREAGADMFMEKPLFQSSIVNAFEKIFSAHKEKLEIKPPQTYDLTGRRILLAEDHPLNVEVAKRMLEKIGAEVVVANNGLEALEAFTTAETGYFDAILMDVRMPIMDGLTAARSIRNLKKAGSRTIPIIAMTTNAFDEDVKQSLANGMDAHLTKPIEPTVLFATIQRLIKR